MDKIKAKINFNSLEEALITFEEAINSNPSSRLEKDGVIQRFEYTFELCWKAIRKILIEMGKNDVSSSPKPLFRNGFEEYFIEDLDVWFKYLDARNRTSHTYNQKTAEAVYRDIQDFGKNARKLLNNLKKSLNELYPEGEVK